MKLRDRAYDSFTEHLLSKKIRSGQFLTQRELVEVTGMPLGAIRELVPRLEADGLLRTVPQRGMQIIHVDLHLIRNAFQLRSILEREAAASFALNASDEDIARIEAAHLEILEDARGGIPRPLVERAQDVDWNFHDALIDHMGNRIISDIYRVNSIKIRLIRHERTRISPALIVSVIEEHMKIIAALKMRDEQAAASAMGEHMNSARARALQV